MADEIKMQFGEKISSVEIKPSDYSGTFDVLMDDEVVYSKYQSGRLPQPGEVEKILFERLMK